MKAREARLASTVAGVVAAALRDAGAETLVLLDDGSPEAELIIRWCKSELPGDSVLRVSGSGDAVLDSHLQVLEEVLSGGEPDLRDQPGAGDPGRRAELHRLIARLTARRVNGVLANPVNRTVALLDPVPIPEPLLPLGDLWASRVVELAGSWSGPPHVRRLAEACGGIQKLDGALARWVRRDVRGEVAFRKLSSAARSGVSSALESARFARSRLGLIPKLGDHTPGIDLSA